MAKRPWTLTDEATLEAVVSEVKRMLDDGDHIGPLSLLSRLNKSQLEKAAEMLDIAAIYNTKTKAELMGRVERGLPLLTPAAREVAEREHCQGVLHREARELLEYAIANRNGHAGGTIDTPVNASLQEKQTAYREAINRRVANLDASPQSLAIKAQVDAWWNSPITAAH